MIKREREGEAAAATDSHSSIEKDARDYSGTRLVGGWRSRPSVITLIAPPIPL